MNQVEEIKKVIQKLRPYLQRDGGDIEFMHFEEGIVYVRMHGACVGCGMLDATLKDGDMNYFKIAIPLVSNCIKSHMGIYTTATYAKGIVLPRPSNNLEWFVHLCDLLSSKKYLEFDFEKYYKTLK